jgi:hypothetical protein
VCPRRLLPFAHRLSPRPCPPGVLRVALGSISLLLGSCAATEVPSGSAGGERILDPVSPEFRAPTRITNPLFPAGALDQVVFLGEGGESAIRVELTQLPQTRVFEWDGRHIETKVVQRVAYRDGQIIQVAIEFHAQADDGSVWRFGAEIDHYAAGVVTANDGSWLAGRDGPPGMVMPAHPAVGDVYDSANVPGDADDEAMVVSTTERVETTNGPVEDAVLVNLHHMDDTQELKLFVPGYGEYRTEAGGETLVVALALPVDARPGPVPAAVTEFGAGALALYDWTAEGKSPEIDVLMSELETALGALEADAPPRVFADARRALDALSAAARIGVASPDLRRASCVAALSAADLAAPYRDRPAIDVERMRLWARMVGVDTQADARDRVRSDVAILETIWSRIAPLRDGPPVDITDGLIALRDAVDRDDLAAVAATAMVLVRALDEASR